MNREQMHEYITERLNHMATRPLMWATNKESFAVQVMTMMEMYGIPESRNFLYSFEVSQGRKGPLVQLDGAPDEEWAKQLVNFAKTHLKGVRDIHPTNARRLKDAADVMAVHLLKDPKSVEEKSIALDKLHSALVALQSTDDLGEYLNAKVVRDMQLLELRYQQVKDMEFT